MEGKRKVARRARRKDLRRLKEETGNGSYGVIRGSDILCQDCGKHEQTRLN